MAVGHALLNAGENGMTAAEMSFVAQQHQSNLKKAAEELVGAGALRRTDPLSANGRRGRKPRDAFLFSDGERRRFEELVAKHRTAGMLGPGTQVVVVGSEDHPERISEVLSQSELIGNLAWWALLNGDPAEFWLAYEGHEASEDSRDLMAAFDAAEVSSKKRSVEKHGDADELGRVSERTKQRIRLTRTNLQAREPNVNRD